MPLFDMECPCGVIYPALTTIQNGIACPKCGNTTGKPLIGNLADFVYTTFSSNTDRYIQWRNSENTRQRLRSGELVELSKSDDVFHM